jgi:hypothetical protein
MFIVRKEAIASLAKHYYNIFRMNAIYILLNKGWASYYYLFIISFNIHVTDLFPHNYSICELITDIKPIANLLESYMKQIIL